MFSPRLLLGLMLLTICCIQYGDAWWSWSRGSHTVKVRPTWIGARVTWTWRFSSRQPTQQQCDAVTDAVIERDEWNADKPRAAVNMPGIAKTVYIYHTGADPCKWIKLDGHTCDECLLSEDCVKNIVRRLQYDDMRPLGRKSGKDDIRYTYLVGQDGSVYEGRGWGVTGQYADDGQDYKSVGIAMIGDFSADEPSKASQDAMRDLLSCGGTKGHLTRDFRITSDKSMAGQSFYNMLVRCKGLCPA